MTFDGGIIGIKFAALEIVPVLSRSTIPKYILYLQ
jgi:hypothetical protein